MGRWGGGGGRARTGERVCGLLFMSWRCTVMSQEKELISCDLNVFLNCSDGDTL